MAGDRESRTAAAAPRSFAVGAALAAMAVQAGVVAGGAWSGSAPSPVHGMGDATLGPLGELVARFDAALAPGLLLLRRLLVHGLLVAVAARVFRRTFTAGAGALLAVGLGVLPLFVSHLAGPYGDAPVLATSLALAAWGLLAGRVAALLLFVIALLLWKPVAVLALPLAVASLGARARIVALLALALGAATYVLFPATRSASVAWSHIPSVFALFSARVGDTWGPLASAGAAVSVAATGLAFVVPSTRATWGPWCLAALVAALPWPWFGEPSARGAVLVPWAIGAVAVVPVLAHELVLRRVPRVAGASLVGALLAVVGTVLVTGAIPRWRGGAEAFAVTTADDGVGGYALLQHARALQAMGKEQAVARQLGEALQGDALVPVRRVQAALLRADAIDAKVPLAIRLDAVQAAQDLAEAAQDDPRWPRGDVRAPRAEAWRLRARVLLDVPDTIGALDALRRAVVLDDASAPAHRDLGRLLAEARSEDDRDEGLKHLERSTELDPSDLGSWLALAALRSDRGDVDAAAAALDAAGRRHARDPRLLHARARLELVGRQDVVRAQEILRDLRENAVGGERGAEAREAAARLEAEIHVALGRRLLDAADEDVKQRQGRLEDALRAFDLALEADPRHWQADVFAGDVHVARRRHAEARARYRKALDKHPAASWVKDQIARTAFLEAAWILETRRNDVDEAAAESLVAEGIDAASSGIDLGFAPLARELAWLRELVTARALGSVDLREPAGDVLRAALLLALGREPEARELVGRVLVALPEDEVHAPVRDVALLVRAMVAERSGDLDGARRDYTLLADRRADDLLPPTRLVEIALRIALARQRTARVLADDTAGIEAASARVAEVAREAVAFADAHPTDLTAGLVAVEAEMHQRRWVDALGRLNRLERAHPDAPAVHRGFGMVYLEHYTASADADLISASDRNLREALRLDPRDVRTLLDASQLAALARDFPKAVRYAEEARRFELVPRGPARRLLVELHLSIARYAMDGGQAQPAAEALAKARALDPSHPGPWRLEAELLLAAVGGRDKAKRLEDALARARRARELAPFDTAVFPVLAKIQRERALIATLLASAKPAEGADPERARQRRQHWLDEAARALEEAIALQPEAPETVESRQRLEAIRNSSPDERRKRMQDAQAAYLAGREHQREGRMLDALRAYRQAGSLVASYGPAWFGVLQTAYELLRRPGGGAGDATEREQEDAWLDEAWYALGVLDRLDPSSELLDRWLYRGLLHRFRYRRDADESLRHAARVAFSRYLELNARLGVEEGTKIEMARTYLGDLTQQDDE
ncbi:MAG: hypothetical protein AB7T63_06515 [Planctomycetota bacterium]